METTPIETKKKEQFKVIPVFEKTRERLKNNMMKVDTYDSYINQELDKLIDFKEQVKLLKNQIEGLKEQLATTKV
jgi:hypothetical protein